MGQWCYWVVTGEAPQKSSEIAFHAIARNRPGEECLCGAHSERQADESNDQRRLVAAVMLSEVEVSASEHLLLHVRADAGLGDCLMSVVHHPRRLAHCGTPARSEKTQADVGVLEEDEEASVKRSHLTQGFCTHE
jgi:hypothetical protein